MSYPQISNQIPGLPRIGDQTPDFTAQSTLGEINFSDFRKDHWVVLFSHPADFTPVCTTELVAFAREQKWFESNNAKIIGVSVDSIHSHLAWVQNVKQNQNVEFQFPLVADSDRKVAQLFGMLHPGESSTAAVRAVFIIDPKGIIRLLIYYPLNVGRNIEEVKRTLLGLQTADASSVAIPANWTKGDKVIVPPPKTLSEIQSLDEKPYEKIDFYLRKKELN